MAYKLVEPAEGEPISLDEAKAHCRVDINDDDDFLEAQLIPAARDWAQEFDWRAYVTSTWELWLDGWPSGAAVRLPKPPLQSVEFVKYYDDEDGEHTLSADAYIVDAVSEPGRVVLRSGQTWPSSTLRVVNSVVVQFVAGYEDAAAVPPKIKQALLLLIGHWYENRETVLVGTISAEMAFTVKSLLGIDHARRF